MHSILELVGRGVRRKKLNLRKGGVAVEGGRGSPLDGPGQARGGVVRAHANTSKTARARRRDAAVARLALRHTKNGVSLRRGAGCSPKGVCRKRVAVLLKRREIEAHMWRVPGVLLL